MGVVLMKIKKTAHEKFTQDTWVIFFLDFRKGRLGLFVFVELKDVIRNQPLVQEREVVFRQWLE